MSRRECKLDHYKQCAVIICFQEIEPSPFFLPKSAPTKFFCIYPHAPTSMSAREHFSKKEWLSALVFLKFSERSPPLAMWLWCAKVTRVARGSIGPPPPPRAQPFEEWMEGCSQRDTNLCGANAHPTDELSLARGKGGEQRMWSGECSGVLKKGTTKAVSDSLPRGVWIQALKHVHTRRFDSAMLTRSCKGGHVLRNFISRTYKNVKTHVMCERSESEGQSDYHPQRGE